jgi:hypothetical protein
VNSAYRQSSGTFMAGRLHSHPGSDPWLANLVSLLLLRMRPGLQDRPDRLIGRQVERHPLGTLLGCGLVLIPWRVPTSTAFNYLVDLP